MSVRCLEANDRIGGRVFTVHDALSPLPIELGAEFIHGRPRESWDMVESAGLLVCEHTGLEDDDPSDAAEKLLKLSAATGRRDEAFGDVLQRSHRRAEVKQRAAAYIEGFNAAPKERISAAALKQDARAAGRIDGGRTFRILDGYRSLVQALIRDLPAIVELNTIVEEIEWRRGSVRVTTSEGEITCRRVIVTVSLGVLKARAIRFDPEPGRIVEAVSELAFGQVYRVTFRFDKAFWEEDERLAKGFLMSREKHFPAWWTPYPVIAPLITGWSAGPAGESLQGTEKAGVVSAALASLGRILDRDIPRPANVYFHDWHQDPFFRGAYSYVPAGAMPARRALAEPVDDTLYFAGEAANTEGHGGTVHGAIASGRRAAQLILTAGSSSARH